MVWYQSSRFLFCIMLYRVFDVIHLYFGLYRDVTLVSILGVIHVGFVCVQFLWACIN